MKFLTDLIVDISQEEVERRQGVFYMEEHNCCEQCGKETDELSMSRDYAMRCIPCNWRLPPMDDVNGMGMVNEHSNADTISKLHDVLETYQDSDLVSLAQSFGAAVLSASNVLKGMDTVVMKSLRK